METSKLSIYLFLSDNNINILVYIMAIIWYWKAIILFVPILNQEENF